MDILNIANIDYEETIKQVIKEVKETTSKEVAELAYKNFIKEYSFSISDQSTICICSTAIINSL